MSEVLIISGKNNVQNAIALLDPISREATRLMVSGLPTAEETLMNYPLLHAEMIKSMAISAVSQFADEQRAAYLIETQGHQVITIAASVLKMQLNEKKYGWLKKAAGIGAGVLIGSLFG